MQLQRKAAIAAVSLTMALALAACGDKTKTASSDDDGAAATASASTGGASTSTAVAAPPAVADVAAAPAGSGSGSDDTTIGTDDEKLATGQFYDAYPLDIGGSGEGIELTVNSQGFKPVVILLDPNQQPLSESTAMSQNPDGTWTLTVSETFGNAGRYYVIIAAEQVGATGRYSVDARRSRTLN